MGNPWFRILWCRLFGGSVVATEDHDGEVVYRIARVNAFGKLVCKRYSGGGCVVQLLEDGKTQGVSFVQRWIPIWPKSNTLLAKIRTIKESV